MPPTKAEDPASQKRTPSSVAVTKLQPDAASLLKADHRKVATLFEQYKGATAVEEKMRLAREVCKELVVHTKLEEDLFYPACRKMGVEDEMLDEAQVEHDGAKALISELLHGRPEDDFYDAKVSVLSEYVKHHVSEEEKPRTGILARARKNGVDMQSLGRELQERKTRLAAEIDTRQLVPPPPRTLHTKCRPSNTQENGEMARNSNERERDEQGRFMSEDGGRSRSWSHSRGREYDEDEGYRRGSRGGQDRRGWYGDPEGHSQASERGWEGRSSRRESQSRNGDYDEDQDYRRSGRGRGHGGWFGDPEGHSEASEKGWEARSSSRGSHWSDRDYDDESNDRRGSRSGRHGGWFGDPEGHSEASERGWEGRSSRGRDYEGDDEGYRSSRGRGHGGWYGDPRGHSQAARRGWEDRD